MIFPLLKILASSCLIAVTSSLGFAQTIYETVKLRNPLPTPNHLTGIEVVNNRLIAFGETGTLLSSDDGSSWTSHQTGYEKEIEGIVYGNGIYVALGVDNRYLLTSTDLEDWTLDRPSNFPFNPKAILFREGKFWVSGSGSTVSSSVDGVTWEQVEIDEDYRSLSDMTYGNGLYMVVARDLYIATSPDGSTWTPRPTGMVDEELTGSLLSVQYRNGRFIVGGAQGTLLSSVNASDWTSHTTPTESWVFDVEFYDGNYYLPSRSGELYRSSDLDSWELIDLGPTDTLHALTQKGGVSVIVGRSGGLLTSSDLNLWTDQKSSEFESVEKAKYIGGRFILSTYSNTLYESDDTLTWEVFHESDLNIKDFLFADGKWVTIGSRGQISQSLDGVLWGPSVAQFEGTPLVLGIRYLDDRWFLFGSNGFLRSSTNLNDWTVLDPDATTRFNELIFENGLFVAVGDDGAIFTSSNGVEFVSRESGTDRDLRTVAFGNNTFAIGGTFIQPLISSDGVTWSNEDVSGAPTFNSMTYENGLFVGCGFTGSVGYSQDARNWTTINVGTFQALNSISSGNDRVLLTGNGNLIMSSDALPSRSLTLTAEGDGLVSSAPAQDSFLDGTLITLTATPNSGNAFTGWSGDLEGTENPVTVIMDSDKEIVANFAVALVGYELWRASEFNASERSDDSISGPLADPDQDGRSNRLEYYLASRPKSLDPPEILTIRTVELGGGSHPVVSYQRRKNVTDLTERIEISDDLVTWMHNENSGETQTFTFSIDDNGDGTETVSHRASATLGDEPAIYFRLSVE